MIIIWIVNDVFLVNRKLFLIVTYEMDDVDQLSEEVISLVKFLLNQEFVLVQIFLMSVKVLLY